MKAEIDGIKLDGTPQEVYEFIMLKNNSVKKAYEKVQKNADRDWDRYIIKKNPYYFFPDIVYCNQF